MALDPILDELKELKKTEKKSEFPREFCLRKYQ